MTTLELKIPPPAVALLVVIAMWLAASASSSLAFTLPARLAIALAVAALGVAISAAGTVSFWRAKTTVNPMYLGLLLVLAGWAIYLSNAVTFVGPLLFLLYINRFQIVPEERALAARFGLAFDDYRRRTRRWI